MHVACLAVAWASTDPKCVQLLLPGLELPRVLSFAEISVHGADEGLSLILSRTPRNPHVSSSGSPA